ncbi:CDP-alcohol phosphatidyltransferase family protein [Lacibacterium aquatile]|uniref:CDP-alcohol phosphatidyltransferase family protein n=1 Tax=Lacibacterium aquatile TaxID=1168082 RepID=A0ABW5DTZ3_9PROT
MMIVWIDTAPAVGAPALFGLPPVTRLRRSIAKVLPTVGEPILSDASQGPLGQRLILALKAAKGPLLVIDGATVIDSRLIGFLGKGDTPVAAFHGEGRERAVIARLTPEMADSIDPAASDLLTVCDALVRDGRIEPLANDAMPGFMANLRRSIDFWLFTVSDDETRKRLERWMFWSNYKGSTDLLTRWVFPPIVWPLTQLATRWHIHPNLITFVSIIFTFAAVPLFAKGMFFWGFVLAFGMCILDSVDGKVARLTLTDSPIGNILDHGLDIIHPPLWYGAWAFGLGGLAFGDPMIQLAIWLIGFYVADRIVLGIAKARFKRGLHAMTELDGKVRAIIARRNINLVIFGVALLLGKGEIGLIAVTAWQGLTLLWHTIRTIMVKPLPLKAA